MTDTAFDELTRVYIVQLSVIVHVTTKPGDPELKAILAENIACDYDATALADSIDGVELLDVRDE